MSATSIGTLKAHLALNVKDVETSIQFYKKMLGVEPSKVRTGYAKFDVHEPAAQSDAQPACRSPGRGALSHLGIQVATSRGRLWR
jgi:catechol 2,3-dioxygenase-like lactoylglutathione lyase family enzyme